MKGQKLEFVHLHTHTEYSLQDGMLRLQDDYGRPAEFLKSLSAQGTKALAITDHDSLSGAEEFYRNCRAVGIKPIIGNEITVASGTPRPFHLTLLARNLEGYRNLLALAGQRWATKTVLRRHSAGLIALSGCPQSELARAVLAGNSAQAEKVVEEHRDIFGKENLFLELMDHGLQDERALLAGLIELSRKMGEALVATNDCHYFRKEDWKAHDARLCLAQGTRLGDPKRFRFQGQEYYFKTTEEMIRLFSHAPGALANAVAIAERCNLELPPGSHQPPAFTAPAGQSAQAWLKSLCFSGLRARRGAEEIAYVARLRSELAFIQQRDLADHFLVVADLVRHCRERGFPVGPGRGSSPGSLAAYCLGITAVDPIENGLLFERFLIGQRPFDIGLELSPEAREAAVAYLKPRYGQDHLAQVITYAGLRGRIGVWKLGRVLGLPAARLKSITRAIAEDPWDSLATKIESTPALLRQQRDPQVKELFGLAKQLEGVKLYTGVDGAAIVLSREPLQRQCPMIRRVTEGMTASYGEDSLRELGIFRLDLLSQPALRVLQGIVRRVQKKEPGFRLDSIPGNDPRTFQLLQKGALRGIPGIQGGMREVLRRLRPERIEDLQAALALFRPGPMESGMLDQYLARRSGANKWTYAHPLLRPILEETCGMIIYQEQLMAIAERLAGFTAEQADALRKAFGKHLKEEVASLAAAFIAGAAKNGIARQQAEAIFKQMQAYGSYSFMKSHVVGEGRLAYQLAYLKAHYGGQFVREVRRVKRMQSLQKAI